MSSYGPRDIDVRDFIDSIPNLTDDEWSNSTVFGLGEDWVNAASGIGHQWTLSRVAVAADSEIRSWANAAGLFDELANAQEASKVAVRSLSWLKGDLQDVVARVASLAVGAIVVLDTGADYEKLSPLFRRFKSTHVRMPPRTPPYARTNDFGPFQLDVEAFISSLAGLTESEWQTGLAATVRFTVGLSAEMDAADIAIANARGNVVLDRALDEANAAVRHAVRALDWPIHESGFVESAHRAVGALVILDTAPIEELVGAFRPFRQTRVELPLEW